jgi:hypothetical protein
MIDLMMSDFKHPALYTPKRSWRRWLIQILMRMGDGLGNLPHLASGPCSEDLSCSTSSERFPIVILSAQSWYVVDIDNIQTQYDEMADAYVLTDHGIQLVFEDRRHIRQPGDCLYAYAGASRGYWPMRLSSKVDRNKPRHMYGITPAGRALAQAWNACANYAASLQQSEVDQLPKIR